MRQGLASRRQSPKQEPSITDLMDSQDTLVEQAIHSLGRVKQIGKEKDDLIQVSLLVLEWLVAAYQSGNVASTG